MVVNELTPRQLERDVSLNLSETQTVFLLDVPQFAVQSGASAAGAAGGSTTPGAAAGAPDAGVPPPTTPAPDAAPSSASAPSKPVEEKSEEVLIIRASNARYAEVTW